jgi:hypothetical protein
MKSDDTIIAFLCRVDQRVCHRNFHVKHEPTRRSEIVSNQTSVYHTNEDEYSINKTFIHLFHIDEMFDNSAAGRFIELQSTFSL